MKFAATISNFHVQLKKARLYRGYEKQVSVCQRLDLPRQVWSLWEQGKRRPSIEQLAAIANLFQLKIDYFFIPKANPEDYDLL